MAYVLLFERVFYWFSGSTPMVNMKILIKSGEGPMLDCAFLHLVMI